MKAGKFKYIYGPVSSWRLGSSLGIDLLPTDKKICSFDCVYCQIGKTLVKTEERKVYIPTKEIIKEIKSLPPTKPIDYITFSGSGEPALAGNLAEVIKEIRALRKEKITVITNSSLMRDKSIRNELALADLVMAKLDAFDQKSLEEINRPLEGIKFEDIYDGILSFRKEHDTKLAIQIMFLKSNKDKFKELAKLAFKINPDEIEINTPLRPCAAEPLSEKEITSIKGYFEELGKKLGSKTTLLSVYEIKHKKVESLSAKDTLKRRGKTV